MKRKHFVFGLLALSTATPVLGQCTLIPLGYINGSNGFYPNGGLTLAGGTLYGTTSGGGHGTVFSVPITGGTPATLILLDGTNPQGELTVVGSTLYGTTEEGGANSYGNVFSAPIIGGTPTTLVSFNVTNGAYPWAGVISDAAGNLYGTTNQGGAENSGTVFSVPITGGTSTTLATFNGTNGDYPEAGLILAGSTLYGTTSGGGNGYGTVFSLPVKGGKLTTLAAFNGTNGTSPGAGVIADAAGDLFGTTGHGGASGDGTVFEVAAGSNAITTLVSFNGTNGQYPNAGLIADAVGNLYGTTEVGGANNVGTLFEITAGTDAFTTLASFNGTNGAAPIGSLISDAAGILYGATIDGAQNYTQGLNRGDGTVFEVIGSGFVVPEPASLSLLALGGLGLLARRRRS